MIGRMDKKSIEYIPYTTEVYTFVDNSGEEIFQDLYTFKVVPSNWVKGMRPYLVKFYLEQSLWDLNNRIVRFNCNCKDYINRKRKCKHIQDAERILNKFMEISYDKVPVPEV